MELKIEYIDVEKLTPYKGNAKKHEETDIRAIRKSIKEFGMNDPIGVWGKQNVIVEGHGRLIACKQLGMKKVPCIRLDNMTDEQRKAYTLAHNKTNELAGYDWEKLKVELDEITDLGIDIEALGYTSEELDRIVSQTVIEPMAYVEPYQYQPPVQNYPQANTPTASYPGEGGMMPPPQPATPPPNNLLQDLMEKEFVDLTPKDSFGVTFTFDSEHKEKVEGFIRQYGKKPLIDAIIELVNSYEN